MWNVSFVIYSPFSKGLRRPRKVPSERLSQTRRPGYVGSHIQPEEEARQIVTPRHQNYADHPWCTALSSIPV